MTSGLRRYLELQVQAKTGLSSGVVACGIVAAIAAAAAVIFLVFSAFIWLADRYGALWAALIMAGFFVLVAIIALVACIVSRRRTVAQAQLALEARSNQPWLDPRYLGVGLQITRAIGWKKLLPLAAVALLAAGLAREWHKEGASSGEEEPHSEEEPPSES